MKIGRKKTPTKKQITAMQLLASDPNISPRQAMLKAGYSKGVASNPTRRLFNSEGVQTLAQLFPHELAKHGVTLPHIAKKYAEWLDAGRYLTDKLGNVIMDKEGNPIKQSDYKTQIATGQMLKDIFNLAPKTSSEIPSNVSRRITLDEYIEPTS